MAALSLLLPITYYITPEAALVMLAGVYYGPQYGGAVASILLRLPGTPQSVVTALDGYPMARQGRAGVALFASMVSSCIGSMLAIVVLVLLASWLSAVATSFGAADHAAMMVLGLVAASTIGAGAPAKALAMVVLGLILGCVGTDVNSGVQRLNFGSTQLMDGINLVALAMGLFGVAEVIGGIRGAEWQGMPEKASFAQMMPGREDALRMVGPTLRGTGVGSFFGALPGTGSTISSFLSYALERRIARRPERFGKGAIEGVAGPEAANNAAAITAFVPTLTLGIPGDPIMALMLGALVIHGVQPGPMMLEARPEMFWGLVVSFRIGNLLLLILNLPLIGIWVSILRIPFRWLYPAIIVFVCLGVYSVRGSTFDILAVAAIGAAGHALTLASFSPALLLVGFVLGAADRNEPAAGAADLARGPDGVPGASHRRVLRFGLRGAPAAVGAAGRPRQAQAGRRRLSGQDHRLPRAAQVAARFGPATRIGSGTGAKPRSAGAVLLCGAPAPRPRPDRPVPRGVELSREVRR